MAQQQANAELSLLSSIAQLFGGLPFGQVTGVAGGGTQTGRSSPGLLDYINAGASLAGGLGGLATGLGNWRNSGTIPAAGG